MSQAANTAAALSQARRIEAGAQKLLAGIPPAAVFAAPRMVEDARVLVVDIAALRAQLEALSSGKAE